MANIPKVLPVPVAEDEDEVPEDEPEVLPEMLPEDVDDLDFTVDSIF